MAASPFPLAVWTADYSATVQLNRCTGPRAGCARPPACWRRTHDVPTADTIDLSVPDAKAALYECCLGSGTPFDIYRWVNLPDLALLWPRLHLPDPVRAEWGGALAALGLLADG